MPPVEVPRLNRIPVQNTPSVGRIEAPKLDVITPMRVQSAATEHALGKLADAYEEQQKQAADTTATAAAVEYEMHINEKLNGPNGAKYQLGDPTPVYAALREEKQRKAQAIINQYENAPSQTIDTIKAHLAKVDNKFEDSLTTAQGHQDAVYTTNTANAAVKLTKDRLASDAIIHIDKTDPNTLVPMQQAIDDIYNLRIKEGIKNGTVTVTQGENGQPSYKIYPSMQLQIAKDTSEGVSDAVNNLSKSGDVEGASFLMEKMGHYIGSDHKDQLMQTTKKDRIEKEGVDAFAAVRNLPPDQAMQKLNKTIKDPEVLTKAMAELDSFQRRIEDGKNRQAKDNFEYMGKKLLDVQNSQTPFLSINDLENDPDFKRSKKYMKAKDIEALHQQIEQPKESNTQALNTYYENVKTGAYSGMELGDAAKTWVGLSKQDMAIAKRDWRSANNPSDAEKRQSISYATRELDNQLQAADSLGIKKNDFGKYDNDTQNTLTAYRTEFLDKMNALPPGVLKDPDKARSFVKEFVASKVSQTAFNPTLKLQPSFQGNPNAKPEKQVVQTQPDVSKVPGITQTVTPAQAQNKKKDYSKAIQELRKQGILEPTKAQADAYLDRQAGGQ